MNQRSRRLFFFRTRFVLACAFLAAVVGALDVSSRFSGRTLIIPFSDQAAFVASAWDGLARLAWIRSTQDPIDVRVIPWNKDVTYVRIAKVDPENDKRLQYRPGSWYRGIDEPSGFWAGGLNFGRRANVKSVDATWGEDFLKTTVSPEQYAKLTKPPPPVVYYLFRFPMTPLVVILLLPATLRLLQRIIQELRIPLHQCRTCRYDLSGNTSRVCPECGTPVHGTAMVEARSVSAIDQRSSTIASPCGIQISDRAGVHRILDANFNRAREALRVMEEYARFVLEDASLSAAVKELRHGLGATLRIPAIEPSLGRTATPLDPPLVRGEDELPLLESGHSLSCRTSAPPTRGGATLLRARDVVGDVGCEIEASGEYQRGSALDVVVAAGKRLSEALRVLEEYGKVLDPTLGAGLERIRYRGYEIERRLGVTITARERFGGVRLYVLLTEEHCRGDWFAAAQAALRGGAECIQLREKNLSDGELLSRARRLAELCRSQGALFVVNDRPDIALAAGASGVHVGQDDLSVAAVRRILPPSMIVGVSTHTVEQAAVAIELAPDYIAVGPMFDSATKPQHHVAGPATLAKARAMTSLPLVAIGGINMNNLGEVLAAGTCAICVCQAVVGQDDVERAARTLRLAVGAKTTVT